MNSISLLAGASGYSFKEWKGVFYPANLKAVGTGPYKVIDFKPGDTLRAAAHMEYHVANQPAFDTLEIKGGGDATSAARAVLQTAEYDVGWNLAVEDVILKQLESAGKGKMTFHVGSDIDFAKLHQDMLN